MLNVEPNSRSSGDTINGEGDACTENSETSDAFYREALTGTLFIVSQHS